jgi:hypothetical protein
MRWVRRAGAALALAVAVLGILLAVDGRRWTSALDGGDERYAAAPKTANWQATLILPGDPAASLLEVGDDLSLRDALRRYAVARATPKGFDNGQKQAEARARAEVALADVTFRGSAVQASQAGNLLGVLMAGAGTAEGGVSSDDRAQAAFDAAIRADPANEVAKYNLELLLRRQRVVGTREGPSTGSGARGSSRRGAGAGTPGQGY